uniref:Uncharacterized protein n=1 Tax=Rhizophora mucronata TaxID=61149 RepID=A0A2P2P4H6_RHIMU
MTGGLLIFT